MTLDDVQQENRNLRPRSEPFSQFDKWFSEAREKEPVNPNAMALSTADESGFPNVRMVLMKGFDEAGFVFYTNSGSAKGTELGANPRASICFYWKALQRQVRVKGLISEVTAEEADAYFATRPKDAQIGAWASHQSHAMSGRFDLEKEVARFAAKYALSKVPRPSFWRGYRLAPLEMEFWTEKPFRLHDRQVYRRTQHDADEWVLSKLFP